MVFSALIGFGLFLIGIALYVFYQEHPEKGGFTVPPDRVFPKFIVEELPPGLTGLVLAGVFAAGMSTVSSILHSLSTVTMSDFYARLRGAAPPVSLARLTTIGFGVLCTGIALVADRFGNLLVASTTVNNLFGGPLVGVFLVGMLTRTANGTGVCLGALVGFLGVMAIATLTSISWMWYGAFSAGLTFGMTLLISPAFAAPSVESLRLVYRQSAVSEESAA
jgi:Na+/proline symporter